MIADISSPIKELFYNGERRRLADVIDVAFICDSEHQDPRALDGLPAVVQPILDQLDDMARHVRIDFFSQADEAGLKAMQARLPGQVMWIERYAMAPYPWSWIERHEPKRLGRRGLNDFPRIDAQVIAELCELVDQGNVD